MAAIDYHTIRVRVEGPICFIQLYRPSADNTINSRLVDECSDALAAYKERTSIVVLEGLPQTFCAGADLEAVAGAKTRHIKDHRGSPLEENLYRLWASLTTDEYISVAHVRGKVSAGGVGFAAACDIAIADHTAEFRLSELLFGLLPACVLPFLIRRIGIHRAQYMSLSTSTVRAHEAHAWGLVDILDSESNKVLQRHLQRLRRIPKRSVVRFRKYMQDLTPSIVCQMPSALSATQEAFSDAENIRTISRYTHTGLLPWES